jgi:hypothetical protein
MGNQYGIVPLAEQEEYVRKMTVVPGSDRREWNRKANHEKKKRYELPH